MTKYVDLSLDENRAGGFRHWPEVLAAIAVGSLVILALLVILCFSKRDRLRELFHRFCSDEYYDEEDGKRSLLANEGGGGGDPDESSTDCPMGEEKYALVLPERLPMTTLDPVAVQPSSLLLQQQMMPSTPLPGKGPFVWTSVTAGAGSGPSSLSEGSASRGEESRLGVGVIEEEDIALDHGINQGLGQLHFGVSYDRQLRHLCVRIVAAKDLPAMDVNGSSDPFVRATILPDRRNKLTTSVQQRTLNPKWNEVFVFENFQQRHLQTRTLLLKVIDEDRFSKNDLIGCVHFPLVHLYDEDEKKTLVDTWRFIRFEKKTKGFVGEVFLSLSYSPHNCKLNVIIIQAKNLLPMDSNGEADPFCVLRLFGPDDNLILKKVSKVCRKTRCPKWNEKFTFHISPCEAPRSSLEIALFDKDLFGQQKMGRIRLNSRSSTEQSKHWNSMLSSPREEISQWHVLKHS